MFKFTKDEKLRKIKIELKDFKSTCSRTITYGLNQRPIILKNAVILDGTVYTPYTVAVGKDVIVKLKKTPTNKVKVKDNGDGTANFVGNLIGMGF